MSRPPRPLLILLALACALAVGACGQGDERVVEGETEGLYIDVGELKYQVQISRQLNPLIANDRAYLEGVAPEDRQLRPDEEWFAVFLRVENDEADGDTAPAAREFEIHDTQENVYTPVEYTGSNPFAYRPENVPPEDVLPQTDSPAGQRFPFASVILFKVRRFSLDNRPLELIIEDPTGGQEGTIALDV
jgi:hypothetical protein